MKTVVSVPLSTKVSTSTLTDGIHKADSVLLNDKQSLVYQNALSNMRKKTGNKGEYLLTNGKKITVDNSGIHTDDDDYTWDNKFILSDSGSVLNKERGEWLSSCIYNTTEGNPQVWSAYKRGVNKFVVYQDELDGTNVNKYTYSNSSAIYYTGVFTSVYNNSAAPRLVVNYATRSGASYSNTVQVFNLGSTSGTTLITETTTSTWGPFAEVKYATILQSGATYYLIIGCQDNDQRRCRSFTYNTTNWTSFSLQRRFDLFGTVSPDGIITGEPIPLLDTHSTTASYTIAEMQSQFGLTVLSNGQLKWNLLNNPNLTNDGFSYGWGSGATHYGGEGSAVVSSSTVNDKWGLTFIYSSDDTEIESPSAPVSPFDYSVPSVVTSTPSVIATFRDYHRTKAYSIMFAVVGGLTINKRTDYTPSPNTNWTPLRYSNGQYTNNCYRHSAFDVAAYAGTQHISPDQIGELIEPSQTTVYDNPAGIYWFSNVQADKGKYWDFGPGWSKFMIFVTSPTWDIYSRPYGSRHDSSANNDYFYGCRLINRCVSLMQKEVKLYNYGLQYIEYTTDSAPVRKLVTTTIDSIGTVVQDSYNFDLERMAGSNYTSEELATTDELGDSWFTKWSKSGWRFINCTDSENPFPYFGSLSKTLYNSKAAERWFVSIGTFCEPFVNVPLKPTSHSWISYTTGVQTSVDYDFVTLQYNPIIKCLVGGNLSTVDGFINLIPSIIPVVPSTDQSDALFSTQYYEGLPISHSFGTTLIDSGSEGRNDRWTYYRANNGTDYYLCADGFYYKVTDWSSITNKADLVRIDKLADYRFRVNTIDGKNLIIASDDSVELKKSFIAYNMNGMFSTSQWTGFLSCPNTNSGSSNDTFYWAAGVNSQMLKGSDSSYLLPAVTVPIYVNSDNLQDFNKTIISGRNPIIQPIMHKSFLDDETVEVYYTHALQSTDVTYKSTNVYRSYGSSPYSSFGNPMYEPDLANNSWWITSDVIIFPIGLATKVTEVNYSTPTIHLLDDYFVRLYSKNGNTFSSFNEAQLLNNASVVFTIYANNYYYDGKAIYFAGSDTNTYSDAQFICYALGMEFLGNSGTEAYLYSDFEKRIYIFTGSNTLQASDSLSKFAENGIKDHAFSSHEQTLYLLNNDNRLLIKAPLDECFLDVESPVDHLETTDSGVVIYTNAGYELPRPDGGDSTYPFVFETGFVGDSNSLYNFPYVDVMLYNDNVIKNDAVTITFNVINGITPAEERRTFSLKGVEWKGNNGRIRLVPKNPVGNAFKIRVESDDEITITDVSIALSQVSETTNTKNRGKSSSNKGK